MRNRFLLIGLLLVLMSNLAHGQARLYGKVTDGETKQPVSYAPVRVYSEGKLKKSALTDDNGNYVMDFSEGVSFDSLKIKVSGYADFVETGIRLSNSQLLRINAELSTGVVIVVRANPVLKVSTTTQQVTSGEDFKKSAATDLTQQAGVSPGVSNVAGVGLVVKGAKASSNQVYVDGIPVGSNIPNLPKGSLGEMDVITGGIPAEFGDFTGGVVNITTRGPSAKFVGGMEARTSELLDPFGYNYVEANLTGPIITAKDTSEENRRSGGDQKRAVLGFFLSGTYTGLSTYSPPAVDMYRVKDEVLQNIEANPIVASPLGAGYVSTADFVTKDQMVQTRIKPNTPSMDYVINGKLVFEPIKNLVITGGGTVEHLNRNEYVYYYNMFNFDNNPQRLENTYRGYLRLSQTFVNETKQGEPAPLISRANYTIQAGYTDFTRTIQDPTLKDNFWEYGYLGTFDIKYRPNYTWQTHNIDGKQVTAYYMTGAPTPNGVTFTPGGYNPVVENYTKKFFELSGNSVQSFNDVISNGGLLNGQEPLNVYSLWAGPGSRYTQYSKSQNEEYYLNASGSVNIKNHSIKAGLQYTENSIRGYNLGSNGGNIEGLWILGRQLLNSHLTNLDTLHPVPVYSNGHFTDTVNYNYQVGKQSTFDKNFREHLESIGARDENGKLINDQSIINIDRYKPSDMKLSYFSPDELLNNGNSFVSYYGYNYLGQRQSGRSSLSDFLDPNKRSISAYQPIYMAGYVQDQFQLGDIAFRLGVRVDRFDANQKVLVDPYSLYPVRTAGEVSQIGNQSVSHPGNIGSDYKVYVDDPFNPTKIVGYRNGNTWYDAHGAEVADPTTLALSSSTGTIKPYLVEKNKDNVQLTDASFTDYKPQVNVLPRVSFTFPISDKAIFFANYDVLAVRPQAGNISTFDDYYFLQQRATLTIPNPNLKPEKRVNYELGFNQRVSDNSSILLQAFYGQIRDLVQVRQLYEAYPITYTSYDNIDFGTVKGFTFGYNFVRNSAVLNPRQAPAGLNLSANYTLQFADGTGSNEGSASALISSGQPNLRTPFALDYDVRHQLQGTIDYRFGGGDNYKGPAIGKVKFLENAGINFLFNARSGTPYTRQSNVTPGDNVLIGVATRSAITGDINGSRLPWQFRLDARLDKDFFFNKTTRDRFGNKKREPNNRIYVNAFIYVQNVLDAKNIIHIYRYTGLANDDAYLNTIDGQRLASQQVDTKAFIDQYTVKMNNPDNYISPRFIRVGASINFY